MIIYNTSKDLFDYITQIGKLININTRSGVVKFIIRQYYDEFKYLVDSDSTIYIFLDYITNSYAPHDLFKLIVKYDLEILNNKKHDDKINRIVLVTNNDISNINKILSGIVKIDGIVLIKFVGV